MERRNELTRIRQEVSPLYWFSQIECNLALPLLKTLNESGLLSGKLLLFPGGSGLLIGLMAQLKAEVSVIEPNSEYLRYANALTMGNISMTEGSDPFTITSGDNLVIDMYCPFFNDYESFMSFMTECLDYVSANKCNVSITVLASESGFQMSELDCNGVSYPLFCLNSDQLGLLATNAEQKGLSLHVKTVTDSFINDESLQTKLIIISPTS